MTKKCFGFKNECNNFTWRQESVYCKKCERANAFQTLIDIRTQDKKELAELTSSPDENPYYSNKFYFKARLEDLANLAMRGDHRLSIDDVVASMESLKFDLYYNSLNRGE